MEEWHQKLHNNTTPDDVVICEAYLAFLRSNGDLAVFYRTLESGGVTRARLQGYERPIRSDPDFLPGLKDALIGDFEEFLRILKKLHSGTDLGAAIEGAQGLLDTELGGLIDWIPAPRQRPGNAARRARRAGHRSPADRRGPPGCSSRGPPGLRPRLPGSCARGTWYGSQSNGRCTRCRVSTRWPSSSRWRSRTSASRWKTRSCSAAGGSGNACGPSRGRTPCGAIGPTRFSSGPRERLRRCSIATSRFFNRRLNCSDRASTPIHGPSRRSAKRCSAAVRSSCFRCSRAC